MKTIHQESKNTNSVRIVKSGKKTFNLEKTTDGENWGRINTTPTTAILMIKCLTKYLEDMEDELQEQYDTLSSYIEESGASKINIEIAENELKEVAEHLEALRDFNWERQPSE